MLSDTVHDDAFAVADDSALEELLESEEESLVRYRLVVRWLRQIGASPGRLEQCQALEEIYLGQTVCPLDELISEAASIHQRYRRRGFTRPVVEPLLLAGVLHYLVEPDSGTTEGRTRRIGERVYIQHAVLESEQDTGFQILHEIAEARIGRTASHADVQILTALLAIERCDVRALLRQGTTVATRAALQRFSHLPPWLLAVSVLLRAEK